MNYARAPRRAPRKINYGTISPTRCFALACLLTDKRHCNEIVHGISGASGQNDQIRKGDCDEALGYFNGDGRAGRGTCCERPGFGEGRLWRRRVPRRRFRRRGFPWRRFWRISRRWIWWTELRGRRLGSWLEWRRLESWRLESGRVESRRLESRWMARWRLESLGLE